MIDLLWDVIAARGFERDTYFSRAASDIRALPKLEGTVHVNIALVLKFMPRYLGAAHGAAQDYPEIPVRQDAADDAYLFHQGPAKGPGAIGFADWQPSFDRFAHLPNVAVFREQIDAFTQLVLTAPPTEAQQKDLDYLQVLGQLFTQIVYAQLILGPPPWRWITGNPLGLGQRPVEPHRGAPGPDGRRVRRRYGRLCRRTTRSGLGHRGSERGGAGIVRKPVIDAEAENAFVAEVLSYSGAYEMKS